jgi:glutaredoxin
MTLTLYSRPGCHLCEDMKAVVGRIVSAGGQSIAVEEVDISTDPRLEALYGTEIPVLMIDGRKVAKYRISEMELRRAIRARDEQAGG